MSELIRTRIPIGVETGRPLGLLFATIRSAPTEKSRLNMTANPLSPSRTGRNLAMRLPGISVPIASIVSCLALIGSAARAADAKPAGDPSRKVFEQYCQTCHGGAKPKGYF